jgi:uncharacterized membrane protein
MMLRAFPIVLDALLLLVTGVLGWLMPALTRRDVLFGVTVAPDARSLPAAQRIIRRYRAELVGLVLVLAAGLVVLAVFAPDAWFANGWVSLFVLVPFVLMTLPYLQAYYASRALRVVPQEGGAAAEAAAEPVAELRQRRYGDYVPLYWEALPLAIIAATAIVLAISYVAAPAIIPVHFDAAGTPNAYVTKNIGNFFLLVWVQIGLELLLTGLALLIVHAKSLPGRAESRFRQVWLRYLFGMKALTLAFLGGLAVVVARSEQTGSASGVLVILPLALGYVAILLGSAIVLAVRTGQGGSRLGNPAETGIDRMADRYWKLGSFYVNPQDPSFFVEKRFGIGWTINFGNRWGVIALCGLLAVVVLLPLMMIVLMAS